MDILASAPCLLQSIKDPDNTDHQICTQAFAIKYFLRN